MSKGVLFVNDDQSAQCLLQTPPKGGSCRVDLKTVRPYFSEKLDGNVYGAILSDVIMLCMGGLRFARAMQVLRAMHPLDMLPSIIALCRYEFTPL